MSRKYTSSIKTKDEYDNAIEAILADVRAAGFEVEITTPTHYRYTESFNATRDGATLRCRVDTEP